MRPLPKRIAKLLWITYEYLLCFSPSTKKVERIAPVFVLFVGRSGSKLLISSLNHLPEVCLQYEVLNPHFLSSFLQYLFGDSIMRFCTKKSAIRHIAAAISKPGTNICGAKIQFGQLHYAGLTERDLLEHFPRCKCIVLYRKSMSEQYVSTRIAEQAQCWGHFIHDKAYQPFTGTITIVPQDVQVYYDRLHTYYHTMSTLRATHASRLLFVQYEDLRDNLQQELRNRICPFIRATYAPVQPDFLQQKNYELHEVVDNFDEVKNLLTGPQSEYVLSA